MNGLVLHQLSLQQRPIPYRAALSEMIIPYGDSDPMHGWKHVLDASENNMGQLINTLKLGCDCLGEIHYFDIEQVTHEGEVERVENTICMQEEDYCIQWKHYDSSSQTSEVRCTRRIYALVARSPNVTDNLIMQPLSQQVCETHLLLPVNTVISYMSLPHLKLVLGHVNRCCIGKKIRSPSFPCPGRILLLPACGPFPIFAQTMAPLYRCASIVSFIRMPAPQSGLLSLNPASA